MSERLVPIDDLMTVDDIARLLKMSVNTASNIVRGRDGRHKLKFPKPLVGKGTHAVWLWDEVAEWYYQTAPEMAESRRRATTCKTQAWSRGTRGR